MVLAILAFPQLLLVQWLKRAGVAGSSAPPFLFWLSRPCLDPGQFLSIHLHYNFSYTFTSPLYPFSFPLARLVIVAGPAYLPSSTSSPSPQLARLVIVAGPAIPVLYHSSLSHFFLTTPLALEVKGAFNPYIPPLPSPSLPKARLVIVAGLASLLCFTHLPPSSIGPACHCGRSRLPLLHIFLPLPQSLLRSQDLRSLLTPLPPHFSLTISPACHCGRSRCKSSPAPLHPFYFTASTNFAWPLFFHRPGLPLWPL